MSTRIDRISEEVRKALAEAIRSVKDPRVQNGLVSVVHCEAVSYTHLIGLVLGALLSATAGREFEARAGSAPALRFVLGMIAVSYTHLR